MNDKRVVATTLLALGCAFAYTFAQSTDDSEVSSDVAYKFETVNFGNDPFTQLLGIDAGGLIAGYHGSGLSATHPNKGFVLVLPNKFASENYPIPLKLSDWNQ